MKRAPLKLAIFDLAKAVTVYDEKELDSEFAKDVASGMLRINTELDLFHSGAGLKREQSSQANFFFTELKQVSH